MLWSVCDMQTRRSRCAGVPGSFKSSSRRNLGSPPCFSPTHPPSCRHVLCLLCLRESSLFRLLLQGLSYSALPFAFPYKPPLSVHCLEYNCFCLLSVFPSLLHSPSLISQLTYYVAYRQNQDFSWHKECQGPGRKGMCPQSQHISASGNREPSEPMKTSPLTGIRGQLRCKNQLSGNSQTPQISEQWQLIRLDHATVK